MKKTIKVSAPGKLMLFGEHAVVYNRPCVVTAVDQRIKVFAERTSADLFEADAPDVGIYRYLKKISRLGRGENIPKEIMFVELAARNVFREFTKSFGVKIETKSDFSSEFGFGSSSAVTVGVIKALAKLGHKKIPNKDLFRLSYKTVLDVQGVGSGFDLAAAVWGGTIYFVTGGKKIEPLNADSLSLVVGYTGVKAETPTLVRQVAQLHQNYRPLVEKIFDAIELVTREARLSIKNKNFARLGELANINQGLLESLGVSSHKLSVFIEAARSAGAYGAKLSGAGGGDCMIAFVKERDRHRVEKAIEKEGGRAISVKINARGVIIER